MLNGMSDSIQRSMIENLHSREVDRQSPTGLIFSFTFVNCINRNTLKTAFVHLMTPTVHCTASVHVCTVYIYTLHSTVELWKINKNGPVHGSLSTVTHAPFHASMLRQAGPMHEAAVVGKVSAAVLLLMRLV